MGIRENEILPGTLDLMILRAVEREPAHGYAIVEAIRLGSGEMFRVEEGALYPALHRLQKKGWLAAGWGESEAKRKAKYYRLTAAGRRQLTAERSRWKKLTEAMNLLLEGRA